MARKVNTKVKARLFYEISKQFVTVYVLSQLWGIFFFLMDNSMLNDVCAGDNGRKNCFT